MNFSTIRSRWRIFVPFVIIALIAVAFVPYAVRSTHAASGSTIAPSFTIRGKHVTLTASSTKPPTDAQCRAQFKLPCYSPQEIRNAYDVTPVLNGGYTGKGQTIVIIDSFGSPTIQSDLKTFDAGYGLPDPPSFTILAPLGKIAYNPASTDMQGWAFETTLDVEWSHAMAPDANIVLMTSPVSETQGVQGLPEFLYLEQYAVSHHIGNIISQSWATTEETLFTTGGHQILNQFNQFYKDAGAKGITFLASAGDSGSAGGNINGTLYPYPVVGFPASSPYVTAVGGTSLYASTSGSYQHETVWDNTIGAGGGGISRYFQEPGYEKNNLSASDQKLLNGGRGLPDISWNADPDTTILLYASFQPLKAGYYGVGGTSEGAPQWAGIIADGNQMVGHPLGFINPALYAIGHSDNYASSYHDITVGNNGFAGITGYNATTGWDAATGWGTPKVATLLENIAVAESN